MKRTIRLTESDLHKVIWESVKSIINEELGGNNKQDIQRLAREAKIKVNELNQLALDLSLFELARDTANICKLVDDVLNRIDASI